MNEEKIDPITFIKNQVPVPGEYAVDPVHSFAEFAGQHLIVGQVYGRFDKMVGKITITEDPLSSKAEFIIDSASINTHHPDRDADLRSERFFHVAGYPKITYSSTEVMLEPGGRLLVKGDLTIRGITRRVSAIVDYLGMVNDPWGNIRVSFEGRSKLSRSDFGVSGDLDRETGGFPTGRDVRITVAVEATLKK
jgi:polyisoprenoid-binding protein YceI